MSKNILLLALFFALSGCARAWVIEQNEYGGVIGYKGYSNGDKASEAVAKLVHCPNYSGVSDRLNGASYTYVAPVTNYHSGMVRGYGGYASYSGTSTQYVPMQGHDAWREFTYRCESQSASLE